MKMQKFKKPTDPLKYKELWEIEWQYGPVIYGCYPLHRTLASAVREVQKIGGQNDTGHRLEALQIKRVKVPV